MSKSINTLRSELVQVRAAQNSATSNASDALFSLDLTGIVDMMDPNRSSFQVIELVSLKVIPFPDNSNGGPRSVNLLQLTSPGVADNKVLGQRYLFFDTSVPDASQATTQANFRNTTERWIASATNIVALMQEYYLQAGSTDGAPAMDHVGDEFMGQWVNLQDEDGKGPVIAAPRLIVRLADTVFGTTLINNIRTMIFQLAIRYKVRRLSKTAMWNLLLSQTPGETLIRSGSAAFP